MLIFRPAKLLMDRFSFKIKYLVLAMLFIVFALFTSTNIINLKNSSIDSAVKETIGSTYVSNIMTIITSTQKTRGMTNAYLNGKRELKENILAQREITKQAYTTLRSFDETLQGELSSTAKLDELHNSSNSLNNRAFGQKAEQTFKEYRFSRESFIFYNLYC